MVTTCPHCGKRFTATEEMVGNQATCPGCQRAFMVEADGAPTPAAAAAPPAPAIQAVPSDATAHRPAARGRDLPVGVGADKMKVVKLLLGVGLSLVILSRGCDSIGNRGVARASAKLQIARRDAESKERIEKLSKAASKSASNNVMQAYWREWLFVFGTIGLVIGLMGVGFMSTGAERIVCLVMLSVIMFSIYMGGMSVASSFGR